MNVGDLMKAMQVVAPLELAESWDNVGLLVGSEERKLAGPVLLTIDLTDEGVGGDFVSPADLGCA
jgi:putative NIF3 family GTP cyclohydrolase 1 type 2